MTLTDKNRNRWLNESPHVIHGFALAAAQMQAVLPSSIAQIAETALPGESDTIKRTLFGLGLMGYVVAAGQAKMSTQADAVERTSQMLIDLGMAFERRDFIDSLEFNANHGGVEALHVASTLAGMEDQVVEHLISRGVYGLLMACGESGTKTPNEREAMCAFLRQLLMRAGIHTI